MIPHSDPADSVTAPADSRRALTYLTSLMRGGLAGTRVGVLRQAYDHPSLDPEVRQLFERALADLQRAGAVVIDSMFVESLDVIQRRQQGGCNRFKAHLERCFATRAPNAPVKTLDDILRGRRFHPTVELRLRDAAAVTEAVTEAPEASAACQSSEGVRADLRTAVVQLMESQRLAALVYPTCSNPPRLIGDLNTPHGDNNQLFASGTGYPAITVPMGYTRGGALPAGLSFFGGTYDEARRSQFRGRRRH